MQIQLQKNIQPPRTGIFNTIQMLFLVSAQNDFITGSLKVGGAVGIVHPVGQLIEKEELWGQVEKVLCVSWAVNNLSSRWFTLPTGIHTTTSPSSPTGRRGEQ